MIVEVILKQIYGHERFYPSSPDAQALCKILGHKTLTKSELKICKEAGWGVSIKVSDYILE